MANNYLEMAFSMDLRPGEAEYLDDILAHPERFLEKPDMEDCDFGFPINVEPTCLSIWSEEYADVEHVAWLLVKFMEAQRPQESIGFEWAHTCSKNRPGEFGGGACFITGKGDVEWCHTSQWLSDRAKAHEKEGGKDERD